MFPDLAKMAATVITWLGAQWKLHQYGVSTICIKSGSSREVPGNITSWWRHQMEAFSALLAFCAGNSSVTGEFPAQSPVTRSFGVFFDLRLNNSWVNNGDAGDLRRPRSHHDVIAIYCKWAMSDVPGLGRCMPRFPAQFWQLTVCLPGTYPQWKCWCQTALEWTVELPVIFDAVTLMWCQSDDETKKSSLDDPILTRKAESWTSTAGSRSNVFSGFWTHLPVNRFESNCLSLRLIFSEFRFGVVCV